MIGLAIGFGVHFVYRSYGRRAAARRRRSRIHDELFNDRDIALQDAPFVKALKSGSTKRLEPYKKPSKSPAEILDWFKSGIAHRICGDYDLAILSLDKAIVLSRTREISEDLSGGIHCLKGVCHAQLSQYDEMEQSFAIALTMRPSCGLSLFTRSLSRLEETSFLLRDKEGVPNLAAVEENVASLIEGCRILANPSSVGEETTTAAKMLAFNELRGWTSILDGMGYALFRAGHARLGAELIHTSIREDPAY